MSRKLFDTIAGALTTTDLRTALSGTDSTLAPKLRFNRGYQDGATDFRLGHSKRFDFGTETHAECVRAGYSAGWSDAYQGVYVSDCSAAWESFKHYCK